MIEIILQQKEYVYLFIVVPFFLLMYYFLARKIRSRALLFANFDALERIKKGITNKEITGWKKYLTKDLLGILFMALILSLLIFSFTEPIFNQVGYYQQYKYVIAIDGSFSMYVADIYPTRFDAAKNFAKQFVEKAGNTTKVGVLIFSTESYIIKTPEEKGDILKALDSIKEPIGVETNILKSLLTASNLLLTTNEKTKTKNAIILITDGEDTFSDNKSKEDMIFYFNQHNISIISVGVGTDEGGKVKGFNITYNLKLNENYLRDLAEKTNGDFFRINDTNNFEELTNKLTEVQQIKVAIELKQYLNYAIIILLLLLWLFVSPKFSTV